MTPQTGLRRKYGDGSFWDRLLAQGLRDGS